MTDTKHNKEMNSLRQEIKQLREQKHHLGNTERKEYQRTIRRLQEKVKDKETYYSMMMKFKAAYLTEKRERKTLQRKIKHLHTFYKGLINGNNN